MMKQVFLAAFLIVAGVAKAHAKPVDAYHEAYLVETGERNLERAIALYQNVIEQAGHDDQLAAHAYLRIGICYEAMEKLDEAKKAFQRALSLSPNPAMDTYGFAQTGLRRVSELQEQQDKERLLQQYRVDASSAAALLASEEAATRKRPQFYTAVELFSAGDDSMQPSLANGQNYLISAGFETRAKLSVDPGLGFRVGVFTAERPSKLQVGLAGDFVTVPSIQGTITYGASGEFTATIKETLNYYRALAEIKKMFPISDRLGFVVHAGMGIGFAQLNAQSSSGAFDIPGLPSGSRHSSGFTFEVGPSLSLKMARYLMELGITYTQFPSISETDDLPDIKWHTFGGLLALYF